MTDEPEDQPLVVDVPQDAPWFFEAVFDGKQWHVIEEEEP